MDTRIQFFLLIAKGAFKNQSIKKKENFVGNEDKCVKSFYVQRMLDNFFADGKEI